MLLLVILTPYWAVTKNGPLDRKKEIEINSNYRNRAAKSNNVEDFPVFTNGNGNGINATAVAKAAVDGVASESWELPIESRPQGERGPFIYLAIIGS